MKEMVPVLIIEPDPVQRRGLTRALQPCSQVTECESPGAAMNRLRSRSFTFIITEIRFPEESSMDFLSTVRSLAPSAFILAVSGDMEADTTQVLPDLGINAWMEKPLDLSRIFRILDSHRRNAGSHPEKTR